MKPGCFSLPFLLSINQSLSLFLSFLISSYPLVFNLVDWSACLTKNPRARPFCAPGKFEVQREKETHQGHAVSKDREWGKQRSPGRTPILGSFSSRCVLAGFHLTPLLPHANRDEIQVTKVCGQLCWVGLSWTRNMEHTCQIQDFPKPFLYDCIGNLLMWRLGDHARIYNIFWMYLTFVSFFQGPSCRFTSSKTHWKTLCHTTQPMPRGQAGVLEIQTLKKRSCSMKQIQTNKCSFFHLILVPELHI